MKKVELLKIAFYVLFILKMNYSVCQQKRKRIFFWARGILSFFEPKGLAFQYCFKDRFGINHFQPRGMWKAAKLGNVRQEGCEG